MISPATRSSIQSGSSVETSSDISSRRRQTSRLKQQTSLNATRNAIRLVLRASTNGCRSDKKIVASPQSTPKLSAPAATREAFEGFCDSVSCFRWCVLSLVVHSTLMDSRCVCRPRNLSVLAKAPKNGAQWGRCRV